MAEEAKKQEKEKKVVLEREYIIPLRAGWLKVPKYKRANKATKTLKEFIVRHMKIYDRDLRKVKIDIFLNNEIRFRGMKKPLHKIKVKAIKYDNGEVEVKLVTLPKHIEFELARKARREVEKVKKEEGKEKPEAKQEEKKEEQKSEQEKTDEKEKKESSKEASLEIEKQQAKIEKHTSQIHQKAPVIHRKAMQK